MKRIFLLVGVAGFLLGAAFRAPAQMTGDELDHLLGPIALYPDPLIAEILPASTQPAQITLADRAVQQGMPPDQIDQQPWDNSVKALARYPDVLKWLDDNMAWTSALGQAYASQPDDVMTSIQRLRSQAQSLGNLQSTPQEEVVNDNGSIDIDPANPDTLYVPSYQPAQVYYEPPPPGGAWISWSAGLPVGVWLDGDVDWAGRGIFFWPHDHFRPRDWWREAPGRRGKPPGGVAYWHPRNEPGGRQVARVDRGYPVASRQARPVPSPRELPRPLERPGAAARPVERPAPRPVERPVARPVERAPVAPRPVERPAPAPRVAVPARGALIGVGSARDTRTYSARGQESRGVAPRPATPAPSRGRRP